MAVDNAIESRRQLGLRVCAHEGNLSWRVYLSCELSR